MPTLPTELRNKLERVVIEARDAAELGARAALEALAVHHHEPYTHMKPRERELRNHLRVRARQLGDQQDASGRLAISHLAGECAYEHWHRMLFARFLAENNLLIEPEENMAISLAEAEELAKDQGIDVWAYASCCAQVMLPQIFRPDDPLLQVSFATEHRIKLERLLASLPAAVFTASDALGWVYQFWQSKKKDEVNRSEVKIGADEISAVTQLFTEPYMVEFLLHNTLGAWWAGKKLAAEDFAEAKTEEELRAKVARPGVGWEYLRFVRGDDRKDGPWRPAAGTFDGWPKAAKEIKLLDPCCGSGHFLVAALHHLVPIRMAEEGLAAAEAIDAVLRDNLHGLEIDERCCQIAAFALAFAAWTYPDSGGHRELPELHIACTGIGPQCSAGQWLKLAEESGIPMPRGGRDPIHNGLLNLHQLFSQGPTLGSLINPTELAADVVAADYETIQPYLTAILKAEKADDETRERAIAAAGMVKAADLLAGEYTLVITNVPYLGRGKQDGVLKGHLESHFAEGRADLATAFLLRCLNMCATRGTASLVMPQNWLFLGGYKKLRERLLREATWHLVAQLGEGAFNSNAAAGAFVALLAISSQISTREHRSAMLEASEERTPVDKAAGISENALVFVGQWAQLANPDARVSAVTQDSNAHLLEEFAECYQGVVTGDLERFRAQFWEMTQDGSGWVPYRTSVKNPFAFEGLDSAIRWEDGNGQLHRYAVETRDQLHDMHESGNRAWKRHGLAINRMRDLRAGQYLGEIFDNNVAVIVPKDETHLPALAAFCSTPAFCNLVRSLDRTIKVTNKTLLKIPFDLARWQKVGADKYPHGLPDPESDDPTQWLFHGRPDEAQEGTELQVAVARLLGYRWPSELDDEMRLSKRARALVERCEELAKFADEDGIVCIPSVRGEEPAAEQLLALLNASDIEPTFDLDDWLRNDFFEEHCGVFHDRPFIWHVWDGRKRDGFHALINYHKLCESKGKGRRLLESLTYAYLGEWITRQKDGVKRGEGGADDRLAAAIELQNRLKAILEGEPPFDIFVRWKPLHEQPIGWDPDINDGVRMNIRPFLASDLPGGKKDAGILRHKPNIKWTKDRGKEPDRPKDEYPWFWNWDEKTTDFMGTGKKPDGNRWNDCHYTNKTKQAARDAAKKGGK